MANLYDENNLRTVRLQIVDEITGEPLDFVNVRTNAASVNFSNGEFLEDAFRALTKSVNTLKVDTTKQRQDFDDHVLHGGHVISERIENAIIGTEWNKTTGVMTFRRYDGTSYEWDTALEKIPITIDFDKITNEIIFTLDGGGETRVDVSKLVDVFSGVETSHTKTTVSKDNQITVEIKDDGIQKSYLDKEIRDILDDSVRFNEAYEDKIKGIEEGANKYILPTANDKTLGGIKIGKNLNIDDDGVVTAGNVLYGESKDTATPVNLFLQVDSIGGPSTDPIPTMDDATSYIVNDGNIINFMSTDATYEFITTTDGSVESGLSKDQVEAKFYPGIELINKTDITWYNDGIYNYAVTGSGDGFIYQKNAWVFVDYVLTDDFISLLNSGTLVDGVWVAPTDPEPDGGGSESGGDTPPTEGDNTGEESGGTGSEESGSSESGGAESGGESGTESGGTESGGTTEEESGGDTPPTEGDNTGEESGSGSESGGSEETGGTEESGDNTGTETEGTESGGTDSGSDTPSTGEETRDSGTEESGGDTPPTEETGGTEESGGVSGGETNPDEPSGGTESGTETGGESDSGSESGSDTPSTGDSTGEESGGTGSEESGGTESSGTESGGTTGEESGGTGESSGSESGGSTTEEVEEDGGQVDVGPGGTNPDDPSVTEGEEVEEDPPVDIGQL